MISVNGIIIRKGDTLKDVDNRMVVHETVGEEFMKKVTDEDRPQVMKFLKIVSNYIKLKRIANR